MAVEFRHVVDGSRGESPWMKLPERRVTGAIPAYVARVSWCWQGARAFSNAQDHGGHIDSDSWHGNQDLSMRGVKRIRSAWGVGLLIVLDMGMAKRRVRASRPVEPDELRRIL